MVVFPIAQPIADIIPVIKIYAVIFLSLAVNLNKWKLLLPGSPYPLASMESDVSIEASSDHEIRMETSFIICLAFAKNPFSTCLPMHFCPMEISSYLPFKRGINLKIMDNVKPNTGATLPNK